jgi:nucleoside-diphosphate-sugar epimerase
MRLHDFLNVLGLATMALIDTCPPKEALMTTTPRPKRVLVLGAHGRFGAAAVQAFTQAGWQVLAHSRRPLRALPVGATALHIELHDTEALAAQAEGSFAVVHALNPPYARWQTEALPLAEAGMALALCLGARFVLPGNVYAYGQAMPPLLQEHTPERPDTRKGHIRQQIEARMRALQAQGLHGRVLRAGDFFGSGRGSWFDLCIVRGLASGRLTYPGPLHLPHAWAYVPDLAQALTQWMAREHALPGVSARFECLHFAGHTLTGHQLLAAVQAAAGPAPARGWRTGGMPWKLMRAFAWAVPSWREVLEMRYLWQCPHALDGSRLAAALGQPEPHTALPQAMAQALAGLGLASPGASHRQSPLGSST